MSEKEKNLIPWFEVGSSGLYLSADKCCWKVAGNKVLRRGGARDGETQYKDITYHPSIEKCFKELLSRKIKQADVKSVSDLLQAIRDAHEWLRGEFEAIERITNK